MSNYKKGTRLFLKSVSALTLLIILSLTFQFPFGEYTTHAAEVTFTKSTITSSLTSVESMQAGDMNGDGTLDIVILHNGTEALYYHYSSGFSSQAIATVSNLANSKASIHVANIDGSDQNDLITMNYAWYDGTSNGTTWTFRSLSGTQGDSLYIHCASINNDEDSLIDCAGISRHDFDNLYYYENDGSPENGISSAVTIDSDFDLTSNSENKTRILVDDIDNDGKNDIFASSENDCSWYENNGSASFTERIIFNGGNYYDSATLGDLDGDGYPDIVFQGDGDLYWTENDQTPENGWGSMRMIGNLTSLYDISLIDLDGSTSLDAVVVDQGGGDLIWYDNDGTPENGGWTARNLDDTLSSPLFVATGDFNGDSYPDIVVATATTLYFYENGSAPSVPEFKTYIFILTLLVCTTMIYKIAPRKLVTKS